VPTTLDNDHWSDPAHSHQPASQALPRKRPIVRYKTKRKTRLIDLEEQSYDIKPFHYETYFLGSHLECLFTIVNIKSELEIHSQGDLSDGFEFGSFAGGSDDGTNSCCSCIGN
jgi:hypothetical protein